MDASRRPRSSARAGFTLAEVAVTIVIVGVSLTLVMQALNGAKFASAHTRNLKLARDLGLLTLGEIEAGLYQEELRDHFFGTYAEQDHEEFGFEIVLGDEVFEDMESEEYEYSAYYSRFNDPDRYDDDEDDEEGEVEEAFEKVRIRVTFPKIGEYENQLTLEQWMPWDQVYGDDEEDEADALGGAGE
ncbi:MAG: type II secretion system protein [Planctomycetota bacterium]|jgi:prepilin-type N-terminal cleavage/methylation domain-containing protein|nr:type II secretion system protein [Planctomycetota bacterium]MDP6987861.1 type II secretion system protein [Planctomycetota bacterium]